MSKYLEFTTVERKAKTDVIEVESKVSGDILGVIKWFGRWRQYSFFPRPETIFNTECLNDIVNYIKVLHSWRNVKNRMSKMTTDQVDTFWAKMDVCEKVEFLEKLFPDVILDNYKEKWKEVLQRCL